MPGLRRLLTFLLLISSWAANAQYDEDFPFNLGINVTSVFSSLVGNDNTFQVDNFPLLIRLGKEKKLRLGLGARAKNNEFFDIITNSTRNSSETRVFLKVGYELPIFQDARWGAYWGLDGLAKFEEDKVTSFLITGENTIEIDTYGVGGAGFVGIKFMLSRRLYLSTESSIAVMFNQVRTEQSGSGIPNGVINSNNWEFAVSPPIFLYLNFAF